MKEKNGVRLSENIRKDLGILIDICHANLKNSKKAQSYLRKERGLSDDIISKYKLGYFPQNVDILTKYVSRFTLESLNIINYSGDSKFSEFFCLIIPLFDEFNRPIGINGRTLLSEDERAALLISKYENSKYPKSKTLFGLNSSRGHILKHKNVFICEGPFDQMSLVLNNIKNAVALCGTGLSKKHVLALTKYTDKMTFLFDRDDGGRKGMESVNKKYSNWGLKIRYKILPEGYKDVDEFLRNHSKNELFNALSDYCPAFE